MKRKLVVATVSIIAMAFMISLASQAMAMEKWYTGKITKDGQFITDDGHSCTLAGKEGPAALKNVDKRIEIKGTMMEKEGKSTIEVQSYKFPPVMMKHAAPETAPVK